MPQVLQVALEILMSPQKDLQEVVASELKWPGKGRPCQHGRERWLRLNCMQHDFRHHVGYVCCECYAQWFFEDDWQTEECRRCSLSG